MSTKYRPVTNEPESVWSTPAQTISDEVRKHRGMLNPLNFYEEHGRPGEMGGNFDHQIVEFTDYH